MKTYIRTEEHKKKMSELLKGRKFTEEHKRNISKGNLGKKLSEEHKEKLRISGMGKNKGRKRPDLAKWNKENPLKGKNSPVWRGGISFEPYGLEYNEDLKEVIRNRDRRKCFICEKTELENGEKLTVHHIDYNKRNNNPDNLISLCRKCHSKTNNNRNYWINYFEIKLCQ